MSRLKQSVISKGNGHPGVDTGAGYIQYSHIADCSKLVLQFYDQNLQETESIDMEPYRISGSLYSVRVDTDTAGAYYRFYADGSIHEDGYEQAVSSGRQWGTLDDEELPYFYCPEFTIPTPQLNLPMCDTVGYQLHVRGFTMDASSKVKNPGTFLGLTEKAKYISSLGVNQLILLPAYDFDEVDRKTGKLNYWGFSTARFFIPKYSYSNGKPQEEFAKMVSTFHKLGIEIVMQFYFPMEISHYFIGECLTYWYQNYSVDGFYLVGQNAPTDYLSQVPYLTDAKLYAENASARDTGSQIVNKNLALISDGFMKDIRRYLKGDANMLQPFAHQMRNHPYPIKVMNYISNFNEFSLCDMVSYDYKHNEENGEFNRDGNNNNYSWNCGMEGPSKKPAIVRLRRKQMCNALTMLLLAKGIPMLIAGDEWGFSRNGNNNPYCQDNETSWLNWNKDRTGSAMVTYVKQLILFRKEHSILHSNNPLRLMDYKAVSYPDLSYHGEMAWYPLFEENERHLGLMYCGLYGRNSKQKEEPFVYIASNMHWEEKSFGLPKLPKGRNWSVVLNTENTSSRKGGELTPNESISIPGRSICVMIG